MKQIYRFVYFKVSSHEEAEDITSEVFLKSWNYIVQEKREVDSFSGLLYRIARNCIIDLYRSKAAKPEAMLAEGMDVDDRGKWDEGLSTKMDAERVIEALKKLKHEYREVITLRYVDELEIDAIAVIMEKGNSAVRVTLHRAIKKLQGFLDSE